MSERLAVDIGSTFTKACLIDLDGADIRATAMAPSTVDTDVNEGLNAAIAALGLPSARVRDMLATSSAAGGLRIAAVGLTPELTLEAARRAALGAGGKIVGAFAYRLTASDVDAVERIAPDILLLAGGVDGGNAAYIVQNARRLRNRLPRAAIIVAGNRDACEEIQEILSERDDVYFAANVMPELNRLDLDPSREVVRRVFLERIVQAKGLSALRERARIVEPTPVAALRAVELLSKGCGREAGLGELVAVDVGGATTDVYSCATGAPERAAVVVKGLPEPYTKRTVEADVGVRHSLQSLFEQAPPEDLAGEGDPSPDALHTWAKAVTADWRRVPATDAEHAADAVCARACCDTAVSRHCGALEETYAPDGRVFVQKGKDLALVGTVVGAGGPLAAAKDPVRILAGVRRRPGEARLKPRDPQFRVDRSHILWAMGLLATEAPEIALRIMKRRIAPVS